MPERILVTAALPYVNNVPHLGNIIPTLSADVYHRFLKISGCETIYICGTDEHGTRTEIEASRSGLDPDTYCKKLHEEVLGLYNWLEIDFSNFGRTSSHINHKLTQDIFLKLYENKYIFESTIKQLYCSKCSRYLPDTYVEGECPFCGSKDAKGDQCDECLKILDPTELINPKCKICGSKPELRETKHLFLDLPKLSTKLEEWINSTGWEGIIKNLPLSWVKEGVKPRCITRDIKWGVPVPLDNFKDKVFYVWFDAPIGYIASTVEWAEKTDGDWKSWWKYDNAKIVHFMGKDNVPFHTIIWPSMLIGADDNWNLPYYISSNEYLNYEGGQFSKSRGRGIFFSDIVNMEFSPDVWRFYLMIIRPEIKDSDFDWNDLMTKINGELIGNFGNFINRTLIFAYRNLGEIPQADYNESEKETLVEVETLMKKVRSDLKAVKLKEALKTILAISDLGNKFFQKNAPWELIKKDKPRCEAVLSVCLNISGTLAVAIAPFMPNTANSIWSQLGNKNSVWDRTWEVQKLHPGQKLNSPKILFEPIDKKVIENYEKRFREKSSMRESFKKLDLRVAEILKVDDIPGADKLYKLEISLGIEKRQLVAGIKKHYSKEALLNKKIVVLSNLKPAKIRGVESQGMLLAAEDIKGNLALLVAEGGNPGDVVFVEEIPINPKQITFKEFQSFDLVVNNNGNVLYEGKPLKTSTGIITVKGVDKGAKVR